jgi:hypothetical protein
MWSSSCNDATHVPVWFDGPAGFAERVDHDLDRLEAAGSVPRTEPPDESAASDGDRLKRLPGLLGGDQRRFDLASFLGKVPIAICFAGAMSDETVGTIVGFENLLADFGRTPSQAIVVVTGPRSNETPAYRVPVLEDDGSWAEAFGIESVRSIVTSVLISASGIEIARVVDTAGGTHAARVLDGLTKELAYDATPPDGAATAAS